MTRVNGQSFARITMHVFVGFQPTRLPQVPKVQFCCLLDP